MTDVPGPIELRPIGHVESALTDRTDAPRHADDGAPDAWIVLDPAVADAATRPNPLGLHPVRVLRVVDGTRIHVDALEAVDGTPVVDLEPTLAHRRRNR